MTETDAQRTTELLLARYCLRGWQVWIENDWTDAKCKPLAGQCRSAMRVIVLSAQHLADDHDALDTILHEIAHALTDTQAAPVETDHGPTFRKYFRNVKTDYKRCPIYLRYPRVTVAG
jgi:hypothetical protein